MDELLQAIEDALKRRGLSASAASEMAVGNPSVIKNLMNRRTSTAVDSSKSRNHPIENLIAVADVLGLELYLGPPRSFGVDQAKLAEAFALVTRFDVALSAGPGAAGDNAQPLSPVAFRKDWLLDRGLRADRCVVCNVRGDSMEPLLSDGDLVLLDRRQRKVRDGEVFGIVDVAGDVMVKRVEKIDGGVMMRSDNPNGPTILRFGEDANRVQIIGALAWFGHSFDNIAMTRRSDGSPRQTFDMNWAD